MAIREEKIRLQIPVSEKFAEHIASLGQCFKWSQSAMAGELLKEGVKSPKQVGRWVGERILAEGVNVARGRARVKAEGEPSVYIQTFVEPWVSDEINRLAEELKNTPSRMAAVVLESAARDNGWMIEALGSGPGQALVKFLRSIEVGRGSRRKAHEAK